MSGLQLFTSGSKREVQVLNTQLDCLDGFEGVWIVRVREVFIFLQISNCDSRLQCFKLVDSTGNDLVHVSDLKLAPVQLLTVAKPELCIDKHTLVNHLG